MTQHKFIYQLSTNPIIKNTSTFIGDENDVAIGFVGEFSVMTGMNNSISKTIEAIKNSSLVYISGAIDQATFFELGWATSLNKKYTM